MSAIPVRARDRDVKTKNFREGCQLWIARDKLPSFSFLKLRKPKRRGHKRFRQLWERSRVGREFEKMFKINPQFVLQVSSPPLADTLYRIYRHSQASSGLPFSCLSSLIHIWCQHITALHLANTRKYSSYVKGLFNCPLFWQNSLVFMGSKRNHRKIHYDYNA